MTQVLFFPANKLAATIAPIFNGHQAIVSLNTDRLIDKKHELSEIGLFKHNLQGTSFLNPLGGLQGENSNYAQLLLGVKESGRIGFGLYYRTDHWLNPLTQVQELIPDYNNPVWTSIGASIFKNAEIGATKPLKTPNHGQELYDISGGEFGYDFVTQQYGSVSGGSETRQHTQLQKEYFAQLANIIISSGSYANGAQGGAKLHIPTLLGLRNSIHSVNGNGDIKYANMTRAEMVSKPSTTRTWDAVNAGQFATQAESLTYTKNEIQRAIDQGEWFSDFMHWHSLYNVSDTAFFDAFYAEVDAAINGQDVWRASNNEVFEYALLANSINKIGSYVHNNAAFVSVRFNDSFIGTATDGIPNHIDPLLIQIPLSIQCDFSGTALAGKTLTSKQAVHCRYLGSDKWIFNVLPIKSYKNGYLSFKIEETNSNEKTYSFDKPVLSVIDSSNILANMPVKIAIWSKPKNAPDTEYRSIYRSNEFKEQISYAFNPSNFNYIVGGITRSRVSATISL